MRTRILSAAALLAALLAIAATLTPAPPTLADALAPPAGGKAGVSIGSTVTPPIGSAKAGVDTAQPIREPGLGEGTAKAGAL